MRRAKVFFLSTGLGRDLRGFESHIQDTFELLSGEEHLDCFVLKGGGTSTLREFRVHMTLNRNTWWARHLARLGFRSGYVIQNFTFFFGCIPYLLRHRPDVLYLGDPPLYSWLRRWRAMTSQNFKMIFFTGGHTVPLGFGPADRLQLVTTVLLGRAIELGIPQTQITILPHFIVAEKFSTPSTSKSLLRQRLGLPLDKVIVLSVGAVDASVKRMDYVIREISGTKSSIFLVILGEAEKETEGIRQLAEAMLGNNFMIKRVERPELIAYYQASDIFTLASLREGFGLVTIEALAAGLPVLVHPHTVTREVLGDMAHYGDLSVEGSLRGMIEEVALQGSSPEQIAQRKEYVAARYSNATLAQAYRELLTSVAAALPDKPTHR